MGAKGYDMDFVDEVDLSGEDQKRERQRRARKIENEIDQKYKLIWDQFKDEPKLTQRDRDDLRLTWEMNIRKEKIDRLGFEELLTDERRKQLQDERKMYMTYRQQLPKP